MGAPLCYPPHRFLAEEEKHVTSYKFGVYDLLVLPPSFPYGGMVCPFLAMPSFCVLTPMPYTGKRLSDLFDPK